MLNEKGQSKERFRVQVVYIISVFGLLKVTEKVCSHISGTKQHKLPRQ